MKVARARKFVHNLFICILIYKYGIALKGAVINLAPRGCIPFGQHFDQADLKCAQALGTRLGQSCDGNDNTVIIK